MLDCVPPRRSSEPEALTNLADVAKLGLHTASAMLQEHGSLQGSGRLPLQQQSTNNEAPQTTVATNLMHVNNGALFLALGVQLQPCLEADDV